MAWDASPGAGFTTGTPWIAVNPDSISVNAAAQVGRTGSVYEHYRRLIELRHTDPVVTNGDFELLLADHPVIWAFLRRGRDADPCDADPRDAYGRDPDGCGADPRDAGGRHAELLVAANFSAEVVAVALPLGPEWADAAVVLTSLPDTEPLQPPPELKLRPWESVIWRRTRP